MLKSCYKRYIFYIIFFIFFDQISKFYIANYFINNNNETYLVINKFLYFTSSFNKGISFGLFNDFVYSNLIFLTVNFLIITIIWVSYLKTYGISCCLIIGGAIGNLIDRIFRGAVLDFILLHYKEYSFPVFNCADAFISFGVFLIIMRYFLELNNIKL